jgi:hypothetical protein
MGTAARKTLCEGCGTEPEDHRLGYLLGRDRVAARPDRVRQLLNPHLFRYRQIVPIS